MKGPNLQSNTHKIFNPIGIFRYIIVIPNPRWLSFWSGWKNMKQEISWKRLFVGLYVYVIPSWYWGMKKNSLLSDHYLCDCPLSFWSLILLQSCWSVTVVTKSISRRAFSLAVHSAILGLEPSGRSLRKDR